MFFLGTMTGVMEIAAAHTLVSAVGAAFGISFGAFLLPQILPRLDLPKPTYVRSLAATTLACGASVTTALLLRLLFQHWDLRHPQAIVGLSMLACLLIQAGVYALVLPDGEEIISYSKACLVTLIQVFLVGVMFATVLFLFALMTGGRKSETASGDTPPRAPGYAVFADLSALPPKSTG